MKTSPVRQPIKILLVDPNIIFRIGMKHAIEVNSHFKVIAESQQISDVPGLVNRHLPHIVIMNFPSASRPHIEIIRTLTTQYPSVRLLLTANHEDLHKAIQAGASGYVLKDISASRLLTAIEEVAGGGSYLHPQAAHRLLKEYRRLACGKRSDTSLPLSFSYWERLTPREKEVLQLLAQGNDNEDIASVLSISLRTVLNHINHIFRKLEVDNRTHAIVKVVKEGAIDL